jgi:hypothetical protein
LPKILQKLPNSQSPKTAFPNTARNKTALKKIDEKPQQPTDILKLRISALDQIKNE